MGCFEDHAITDDHNTSITLYQIIKGIHPDDWVHQNNEMSLNRTRGMVSFALGKIIERVIFSFSHERGTKQKFRAPMGNWTSNLPISALRCFTMSHRDSTVSESSLWHASCRRLVSRRLVNTHFIIVFVLVHLLSISVLLVNDYYTISLLSPINVPCKYTYKDFTSVIATKSSLLNRRCSIIATGYLLPLRARPK